jgi:hypothetical protein
LNYLLFSEENLLTGITLTVSSNPSALGRGSSKLETSSNVHRVRLKKSSSYSAEFGTHSEEILRRRIIFTVQENLLAPLNDMPNSQIILAMPLNPFRPGRRQLET